MINEIKVKKAFSMKFSSGSSFSSKVLQYEINWEHELIQDHSLKSGTWNSWKNPRKEVPFWWGA